MRKEIEGRPLLLLTFAVLCGFAVKELLILVAIPVVLAFVFGARRSLAFLLAGCLFGYIIFPSCAGKTIEKNTFFDGILTITSMPSPRDRLQTCEVSDGEHSYQMRFDKGIRLSLGDRIQATGVVESPSELVEDTFRANGQSGVFKPAPGRIRVISSGWIVWRLAADWRNSFLDWSHKILGKETNVSAEALCFNVTSNLTPEYKDSLQRTGTIHIISASGMHVMVFALFLQVCLGILPVPKLGRIVILSAVLLLYSAAAGLQPPVVRSAAMCIAMMSAYAFRREADLLSSLALVCLGYLVLDPGCVRQIGFQLSFLCVASLGFFGFPAEEENPSIYRKLIIYIKYTFKASIVVALATAPVVAYHFGMISLISPIANLAIVWVLGPVVIATLVSSATISWLPSVSAGLLVAVVSPLAKWIEFAVTEIARLPFASINVPEFSVLWLIPVYGLIGIFWKRHVREA